MYALLIVIPYAQPDTVGTFSKRKARILEFKRVLHHQSTKCSYFNHRSSSQAEKIKHKLEHSHSIPFLPHTLRKNARFVWFPFPIQVKESL